MSLVVRLTSSFVDLFAFPYVADSAWKRLLIGLRIVGFKVKIWSKSTTNSVEFTTVHRHSGLSKKESLYPIGHVLTTDVYLSFSLWVFGQIREMHCFQNYKFRWMCGLKNPFTRDKLIIPSDRNMWITQMLKKTDKFGVNFWLLSQIKFVRSVPGSLMSYATELRCGRTPTARSISRRTAVSSTDSFHKSVS